VLTCSKMLPWVHTNVVDWSGTQNGTTAGNAGGAAAAAVSATHNRSNRRMKSVVQDAAVGAVTNVDWRGP